MPTIDLDAVRAAALRIAPYVHRTPVVTCRTLDAMAGATLFLKAENLQRVGAFKYRGATNAVRSLSDAEAAHGVATHSSGNHAQALARAARERGVPAYVVMPRTAPRAKQAAVAGYGAEISFCDAELASREATLREVIARTDARFIHPFDDARVIAGQGTAALELFSDVPDLDAVLAPVGGGGLLSGTAIVARGSRADVRIIGVEPELADDAWQSLREGRVVPPRPPRTVADGLLTALSELTFSILRETGAEIVRVSEREILESMRLLWERAKLVVEPSGAVPVAAALAGRADLRGRRVGVILSGGNVDLCRNELCNFWRP